MTPQIIEENGHRFAKVPIEVFERMLNALEDAGDVAAVREMRAAVAAGAEELVPQEVVNALVDGENPLRVWREHRGMTQQQLADAAGFKKSYISNIENGRSMPTRADTMAKIAAALRVDVDDVFAESR